MKIPKGNQKPYIEEQTAQWPKEKAQKDKQRSGKHTYKTKDRVITSTLPKGTLGSVATLLAATLYQGNPDMNHKLCIIVSFEKDILHIGVP